MTGDAVVVRERACYLPAADALVVSDTHLGKAAASNVEASLDEGADLVARFEGLLSAFDPAEVVVAGDLLDAFDRVPRPARTALDDLQGATERADARFVVTPGNHDTMLDPVYDGPREPVYRLADGETVVCHGHEAPEVDAERYVIGHDHPAIDIEGRVRPCTLYGPGTYRGGDVVMLPAFTRLAGGATVNGMTGADFQSPLVRSADDFHPVVRDVDGEETLRFPRLGDLRELL